MKPLLAGCAGKTPDPPAPTPSTPDLPAPTPPARALQTCLISDGIQDVHAPCFRSRHRHGQARQPAAKQTRRLTAPDKLDESRRMGELKTAVIMHAQQRGTAAGERARPEHAQDPRLCSTPTTKGAYLGLADHPAGKGVDERLSLPRVRGFQNSRHGEPDASHVLQPLILPYFPWVRGPTHTDSKGRTIKPQRRQRWCCARHRQRHGQQRAAIAACSIRWSSASAQPREAAVLPAVVEGRPVASTSSTEQTHGRPVQAIAHAQPAPAIMQATHLYL